MDTFKYINIDPSETTGSTAEDQLSWALDHIIELEERLENANCRIERYRDGDAVEWDLA